MQQVRKVNSGEEKVDSSEVEKNQKDPGKKDKTKSFAIIVATHVISDGDHLCRDNHCFSNIDFRFSLPKLIDLACQNPSCMADAVARIVSLLFDGYDAYSSTGKFLCQFKTVSNQM